MHLSLENKMKCKVSVQDSANIMALYSVGVRGKKLLQRFPQYSRSTIYEHVKKNPNELSVDKRKQNKGRPKKLTSRDERLVVRQVTVLRKESANFTSKKFN